jgi:hypothetical protein
MLEQKLTPAPRWQLREAQTLVLILALMNRLLRLASTKKEHLKRLCLDLSLNLRP